MPIAIKPGGYEVVVLDLTDALGRASVRVRRAQAPWPLALPGRILALVRKREVSVETIARQIATIDLPFEEWEILYRILLQVRLRRNPIGTDTVGHEGNGRPGLRKKIEAAIAALTA